MRTPQQRSGLSARSAGIGMSGLLVAGLAAFAGPSIASAQSDDGAAMEDMHMSSTQMSGMHTSDMHSSGDASPDAVGNTDGWFAGKTYTFHYTHDFFCKEPPTSAAISSCELGENYQSIPADEFDPLYVIVPIGFTPDESSLQCPTAGQCVDHPAHIDLTRVFGEGAGQALLPPHSHIITTTAGGAAEWWNVDVIGVKSQGAWDRIVKVKRYRAIQAMRNQGNPNITGNIPTNLFLFFSVG